MVVRLGRSPPDVLTGQNILFKPHDPAHKFWELKTEGDRLLFYLENQGVYSWSTLVSGDDPPVFGRYERSDPWEAEGITLSEHLILACLFEAISCHSPYGAAAACLDRKTLSEIERVITPVAINPWRWLGPTQFYARNGAFMYSMANGTGLYSVSIGAKTELPLQFLKPYLGDSWEYRAL